MAFIEMNNIHAHMRARARVHKHTPTALIKYDHWGINWISVLCMYWITLKPAERSAKGNTDPCENYFGFEFKSVIADHSHFREYQNIRKFWIFAESFNEKCLPNLPALSNCLQINDFHRPGLAAEQIWLKRWLLECDSHFFFARGAQNKVKKKLTPDDGKDTHKM